MNKRNWKDSTKALESYIDPEQDEQVMKTKIDLDDRVAKLMKHIQLKSRRKKGGGPIFDSELIELVDDFHKKYQTLYSLYEHLKEKVLENGCLNEDQNKSSSSSSSSLDSFHSSYELEPFNECSRLSECLVDKEKELKVMRELILELQMASKQREEKLSDLLMKLEENEMNLMWKSEELVEKANDLQLEVDAFFQGNEIVHMRSPCKSNSESSLFKLNKESSGFLFQLELLKAKFVGNSIYVQKIEEEKKGLEEKVKSFQKLVKGKIFEDIELVIENEDLHVRVSELEESLDGKKHDVFVLETEFEFLENNLSSHIKILEEEIVSTKEELNEKEEQCKELMSKIEDYRKTMRHEDGVFNTKDKILNEKDSMERRSQGILESENIMKLDNDK